MRAVAAQEVSETGHGWSNDPHEPFEVVHPASHAYDASSTHICCIYGGSMRARISKVDGPYARTRRPWSEWTIDRMAKGTSPLLHHRPTGGNMRKLAAAVCAVLMIGAAATAPALADTTSVKGTNSYKKLVVDNGNKSLVFKLTAPGPGCKNMKYLAVKFGDKDGTAYQMDGGCYQAAWVPSLVRGDKVLKCKNFTLKFDKQKGVWTGDIPRSCLKNLGGTIKVTESWIDDYSAMPGEAPATKWVKQG